MWHVVCSQGVQFVDSLVFMGPLQVQLDLLHQGDTVSLSDVQFLRFTDAILLIQNNIRSVLLCAS